MKWNNKLYTKIYNKNNNLINEFVDKNLVVDQGKKIIRDCLIYDTKMSNNIGLRNIKLSENSDTITSTDLALGGTEYSVGLQSNELILNLETEMSFGTTTIEDNTLTIPFKFTNTIGSTLNLKKLGLYDYNADNPRLFSGLMLNNGNGASVPDGGYILSYYKLQLIKGTQTSGEFTDFGIKAIIHSLVYNNTDYNINTVAFTSDDFLTDYSCYLKCENDTSSTLVTDETGTNNFLANVNTDVISVPGIENNGFHLSSGNYIQHPVFFGDEHSISFKVKALSNFYGAIMSIGNNPTDGGANLIINMNTNIFRIYNSSWTNGPSFVPDVWYHVVITRTSNNIDFWVNNVKYVTLNSTALYGDNMYFGIGYTVGADAIFDEILFYNRILNDNEIEYLYNNNRILPYMTEFVESSILPFENNKLLYSFDYTNTSGDSQNLENVAVCSIKTGDIINNEGTTIFDSTSNPDRLFDLSDTTYTGMTLNYTVGKLFDAIRPINKLQIKATNRVFDIMISLNTTNGSDGSWEVIHTTNLITSLVEVEFNTRLCKAFKIKATTGSNTSVYTCNIYDVNINDFTKFQYIKTLLNNEEWQNTIVNTIE